jgi:hypothetical protein
MRTLLRVPLATLAALLLVAVGASATRQIAGGAASPVRTASTRTRPRIPQPGACAGGDT